MNSDSANEHHLAQSIVSAASDAQRQALLAWATELTAIRGSTAGAISKAHRAMRATAQRQVLAPILKANLQRSADVLWNERSWPVRLGIIGLTVGTFGFSGEVAGLAAFGRAIAVPVWLVLTATGSTLGAIIELLQSPAQRAGSTTYSVIEAHEDADP